MDISFIYQLIIKFFICEGRHCMALMIFFSSYCWRHTYQVSFQSVQKFLKNRTFSVLSPQSITRGLQRNLIYRDGEHTGLRQKLRVSCNVSITLQLQYAFYLDAEVTNSACMYVWMYVCMYAYNYECMYECMYLCLYAYIHECIVCVYCVATAVSAAVIILNLPNIVLYCRFVSVHLFVY